MSESQQGTCVAQLFDVAPVVTADVDHHWFVPDGHGLYCLACGLPAKNRRHVKRVA